MLSQGKLKFKLKNVKLFLLFYKKLITISLFFILIWNIESVDKTSEAVARRSSDRIAKRIKTANITDNQSWNSESEIDDSWSSTSQESWTGENYIISFFERINFEEVCLIAT